MEKQQKISLDKNRALIGTKMQVVVTEKVEKEGVLGKKLSRCAGSRRWCNDCFRQGTVDRRVLYLSDYRSGCI